MASHKLKKASDFLTGAKSDNIDKASKEARATDQSYGQLKAKAYLQSEEYKALFDHEHKAMREAERKKLERREEPKKKRQQRENTMAKTANALEIAMKLVRADQLNEEKVMGQRIGFPALVEQMAEEASELAQAAPKVARIARRENPTPVSIEEGAKHLEEEYTDVIQCAIELGIEVNVDQIRAKQRRFLRRWEEFGEEKDDRQRKVRTQ